jgi:hypothetical protein
MRLHVQIVTVALAGLTLGCASSTTTPVSSTVAVGPHHGTMIRLPQDKGFVELVNEPDIGDRRNPRPTSIVAYFLEPDSKSPLSSAPSDVVFLQDGDGQRGARGGTKSATQSIPLNAEPKSDDPAGSSRFASKPGPYYLESFRGTLSAKIGGADVSTAFSGAR